MVDVGAFIPQAENQRMRSAGTAPGDFSTCRALSAHWINYPNPGFARLSNGCHLGAPASRL